MPLFESLHRNMNAQVLLGLLFGICFGFLLQKGGVTNFNIIEGQLLLTDFTVLKLMLSAVMVGMIGFHLLKHFGYVRLHAAEGSIGANVVGGLIFGVGFALLGYCPGTVAGAVGTGAVDAVFGMIGLLLGAGIFAGMYPSVKQFLVKWPFPAVTVPEFLKLNQWVTIIILEIVMAGLLLGLEYFGL
jgi:uncharacterized protein